MSGTSSQKGNGRGPKSKRHSELYEFTDEEGAQALLEFALGAALEGGAVRIGLTRDGGAVALGVYWGEDYATEYIRPDEPLARAVREIQAAWNIAPARWDEDAQLWRLAR